MERKARGRGGIRRLYPFSSLPSDIRDALARVEASEAAAAGRREALKLQAEALAKESAEHAAKQAGAAALAGLAEAARRRAEVRAAVLVACRDYIGSAGLSLKPGRIAFCQLYNTGQISIATEIREQLPSICANSVANWDKHLREGGMARLAGNYGQHLAGSGIIDSNQEVKSLVLGMLAKYPDCTCKLIRRGLKARFPNLDLSMRALQRWVRAWKLANPRLHQDLLSPDQCRSRFQPADGSRYAGIERLNQRWELDSTKGDVMLNVAGSRTRHMIVACLDVYSRRVKFLVSRSSSSAAVASLLRRCMLDWGLPEELGTDNGTDFVSDHICRIAQALDVARDVAPPYTPEHKPYVERVFNTFLHDLVEGVEGYIGHNVAQRKAIEDRKAFAKRVAGAWRKGEGEPAPELLMTPDELQVFCDEWSDAIYAHEPHTGEGMHGKSPWEKITQYGGPIRKINDERALDVLLSPVAGKDGWRQVTKKGLRVEKFLYTSPELGGHEGKTVHVLEDTADWGAIHVFLPNQAGGQTYLCRAVCPEILGISRRDMALARKRVYAKVRAEEKAALAAVAKQVDAQDIVRDIREQAVENAGKLSRLPQPSTPHETEALRQAGIAARAQDGPEPAPAGEAQAAREYVAREMAKPAVVHQMSETPRQRYSRWLKLDQAVAAGAVLSEQEQRFWQRYPSRTEYMSMRDEDAFFGAAKGS